MVKGSDMADIGPASWQHAALRANLLARRLLLGAESSREAGIPLGGGWSGELRP